MGPTILVTNRSKKAVERRLLQCRHLHANLSLLKRQDFLGFQIRERTFFDGGFKKVHLNHEMSDDVGS